MTHAIEQQVISAVLANPHLAHSLELGEQHFTNHAHKTMWSALRAMVDRGETPDPVGLMSEIGGAIGNQVISIANDVWCPEKQAEKKAKDLIAKHDKRRAREILESALENASSPDEVINNLMSINTASASYETTASRALGEALDEAAEMAERGDGLRGITTGFAALNSVLSGLVNSDLVVAAARPAMGKTSLLSCCIGQALKAGHKVGFISGEQPAVQIAQRHVAQIGRVRLTDIRGGKIGEKESAAFMRAKDQLGNYPMYCPPAPHIDEIERVARRWVHTQGIEIIYIDYLQRIEGGRGRSKAEEIADITTRLKSLARQLNIPIFVLAQVKREVEDRNNRRPNMGDISDSSGVEKEADVVLTMYRDEVYNPDSNDAGICELRIAKNRHGPVGTVRVGFAAEHTAFFDIDWSSR